MNKSLFWIKRADAAAAVLCLLASVIVSPDWAARGLVLLNGGIWAALGWKLGLSQSLLQFLLLIALRLPQTTALTPVMRFAAVSGALAWLVALWKEGRLFALVAGLLWALPALLLPPLWPLVLASYPRLGRMQAEHASLARGPGLLLLLCALGFSVYQRALPPDLSLLTASENYLAWGAALADLFATEVLWLVLPIAGVFEIAQKQPGDLRVTWRNLPPAGMLLSAVFFLPAAGIAFFYALALPLTAILLTRWTLALPGCPPRALLWLGLVAYSLPLLFGGHA